MAHNLPTGDLAERASRILSDPALSPYTERTSTALKHTIDTLVETAKRHGPPPGFDTLRGLALAIIADHDEQQQKPAA